MVIICGLSVFPTMQTLIAQEVSRKLMRRLQEDPRPPWNDPEWMGGRDARAIRIMTEFLAPQSILFDRGIRDTVVFFGSARTDLKHADAEAAREIAKRLSTWATTSPKEGGGQEKMEVRDSMSAPAADQESWRRPILEQQMLRLIISDLE